MMEDAIFAAVRTAWQTTLLRDQAFDPDLPLGETGADSLRLMQLVLRLEQALQRKVPYDLLSPPTTPRGLAAMLAEPTDRPIDLPQVFFLPGLGGDNGLLPMLREAFTDEIQFTLLEPPGVGHPDALLGDLAATAGWIADVISVAQPYGSVRLAGYSMGGIQAFETSRHLIALGRDVRMLCLFDAIPIRGPLKRLIDALRRPSQLLAKLGERLPRLRPSRRAGAYRSLRVDMALRIGAYGYAGRAARATATADAPADYGEPAIFRLWSMRVGAARRWRPSPLAVPTVLVLSEDGVRWGAARFWRKLVTPLTIVPVGGRHNWIAHQKVDPRLRELLKHSLRTP